MFKFVLHGGHLELAVGGQLRSRSVITLLYDKYKKIRNFCYILKRFFGGLCDQSFTLRISCVAGVRRGRKGERRVREVREDPSPSTAYHAGYPENKAHAGRKIKLNL